MSKHLAPLLAKREELLLSLQSREGIQIEGRLADPLDEAAASADRVRAAGELHRQMGLLTQVKKAIARVVNGEFGECEGCGQEIPEARLSAAPWAELCLGCQERKEEKGVEYAY